MAERPVAIVIGGARRVGRAICLHLAQAGYDLLFTYNHSEDDADAVVAQAERAGVAVTAEQLDLADVAEVQEWAMSLVPLVPRLDALVHNAALYHPTPLAKIDAEEAQRFFRINALAPLLITAAFADSLIAARGAVVALTDIHAEGLPRRDYAPYAMSKAALAEMVRSLARDLAPRVRVNALAPGVVAWPETGPEADRAAQERYLTRVPLERSGTIDEAAKAVLWLIRDATYITGQTIRLDGGRSLL
jgi:pteridine reductase